MHQLLKLIHIVAAIIFLALTGGASDTLFDWTLYRSKSVQWELCRWSPLSRPSSPSC